MQEVRRLRGVVLCLSTWPAPLIPVGRLGRARGKNVRAVPLPLGHSKLESTVRTLGIEVDDALEISDQTEI
jgi:hypothetical protein